MMHSVTIAVWLVLSLFCVGGARAQNELPKFSQSVDREPPGEQAYFPVSGNDTRPDFVPDLAYGAYQRGYYLTALRYALPRALRGDAAAQTLVAELYDKGLGVRHDGKEATRWYGLAAGNGSSEAGFSYAMKLMEGKYIEKDEQVAQELLRQSADAGNSLAQFGYAQLIAAKRPTSKGFEIALGYYEKAAAMGVADAYLAMANIHARGFGSQNPDKKKARKLLVKAARGGVIDAQVELGIWLANGRGGPKDMKNALLWFKRAASRGNVIAQNRLARMLAFGIGTAVKPVEAARWYLLSRWHGYKDIILDNFFSGLSTDMRKKAFEEANRHVSS